MIDKAKQVLNKTGRPGSSGTKTGSRDASGHPVRNAGSPDRPAEIKRGSETWIPFASYCTTGQFMDLENGYKRHCSPTAAVNIVRTLQKGLEKRRRTNESSDEMFLRFANIGRRTRIYWNQFPDGYLSAQLSAFRGTGKESPRALSPLDHGRWSGKSPGTGRHRPAAGLSSSQIQKPPHALLRRKESGCRREGVPSRGRMEARSSLGR